MDIIDPILRRDVEQLMVFTRLGGCMKVGVYKGTDGIEVLGVVNGLPLLYGHLASAIVAQLYRLDFSAAARSLIVEETRALWSHFHIGESMQKEVMESGVAHVVGTCVRNTLKAQCGAVDSDARCESVLAANLSLDEEYQMKLENPVVIDGPVKVLRSQIQPIPEWLTARSFAMVPKQSYEL